jgi:hypothetical protein
MKLLEIKVNAQEEINMLIDMLDITEGNYNYIISKELPGIEVNGKKYDLHIDVILYIDSREKYATINHVEAILQADAEDYFECEFCYNETLKKIYNML